MSKSTGLTREQAIGYVNRYRGRDGVIWSGRTIFASPDDAQSCPCASKESYVDTLALLSLESRERITELEGAERRYEYVRRLNVPQFKALFVRCLHGERFDDVVDLMSNAPIIRSALPEKPK
jgi:hypothetical protein